MSETYLDLEVLKHVSDWDIYANAKSPNIFASTKQILAQGNVKSTRELIPNAKALHTVKIAFDVSYLQTTKFQKLNCVSDLCRNSPVQS